MKKLLALCPILFLQCHQIHEGKIIEKHTEPTHSYTWLQPVRIGKTTTYIPHTCTIPERYAIEVRGVDKYGDTMTEKFYIPKWEFDCECVGAKFNDTLPCEKDDNR